MLIRLQDSVLRPAGINKICNPYQVADSYVSYVNMYFNRVFSHAQMSKVQTHVSSVKLLVTEYLADVNKLLLILLHREIFETFQTR